MGRVERSALKIRAKKGYLCRFLKIIRGLGRGDMRGDAAVTGIKGDIVALPRIYFGTAVTKSIRDVSQL